MKMRKLWYVIAIAALAACTEDTATDPLVLPVLLSSHGHAHAPTMFRTQLTGSAEVPPNDSRARGHAMFRLSADGTELHYTLVVANILNVTQAHIHVGPPTGTGDVVAWLYPAAPPSQLIEGRSSGVLGEGVITDASLVGPLAGMTLEDLLEEIMEGNAYVNVHTQQIGAGEIRGQLD
jgi:hypothetical protein